MQAVWRKPGILRAATGCHGTRARHHGWLSRWRWLAGLLQPGRMAAVALVTLALALMAPALPAPASARAQSPLPATAAHPTRWGQWFDTSFMHYNDQHGLPNGGATSLAQDGDGFLWIGTQDGLVRWDGYRFRTWLPNSTDPHSLPDNYIQSLHRDARGQLWIGTLGGGLARYVREQDRFMRWQPQPGQPDSLAHVSVTSMADDGAGGLWVGTHGGLDHLAASGRLRHVWPQHAVTALQAGADGTLWIASDKQLFRRRLQPDDISATPARGVLAASNSVQDVLMQAEFPSPVYCLFLAKDQRLWLGTRRDGAYTLDPESGKPQPVREGAAGKLAHEWISTFAEPDAGEIWIGSAGQGIAVVGGNNPRLIRHNPLLSASVADDTIETMLVDHAGLLWLGTQQGISVHYPQTGIRTLYGAEQRKDGLIGKDVRSVLASRDGRIWLGFAFQGVQILDPASHASQILAPDPARPLQALPASQIMVAREADNGDILLGTGHGVYRVHQPAAARTAQGVQNLQIERLDLTPRDNVERTTSLLIGRDRLWIGSNRDSLWQFPLVADVPPGSDGKLRASRPALLPQLADQRITSLENADNGNVWIGTQNGLHWIDPQQQRVIRIPVGTAKAPAISSANIVSTLTDRQGRIWVGTSGTGIAILSRFDARSMPLAAAPGTNPAATIRLIGMAQGLPNGVINKLLEDQHGDIWASTDNGLAVINGRDFSVRALQRADGVAIGTYWSNAGAVTRHGELLFGGLGGLTVVQPVLLRAWQFQPPVVISDIRIKGKPVPANRYFAQAGQAPAATLQLSPDENQFTVEFAALDFSAPDKNRYAWRLAHASGEWMDPEWTETDASRRLASFANLAPGQYQLHMRGSNRIGIFNPRPLILRFDVLPAWYQSWWWYACLLLALAAMLAGVVQIRTRSLRAQRQRLEEKVERRTRQLHEKQTQLEHANHNLQQVNTELEQSAISLRQTQAQLVQQEKMAALGALVTGVAHELNTPLGVSLSALDGAQQAWRQLREALQQERANRSLLEQISAEGDEFTALALRNSQRAADLVTHFKAVDVVSSQQERLDLASFLRDFAQVYGHEFELQGHQLILSLATDLPEVRLVPEALSEALQRIFGNIRDHAFTAGQRGVIKVSARCTATQEIEIVVSDNGEGIAPDAIDKVFDPFFSSKTGNGKHIGLGLHIAWNQVTHRLHGRLAIRSTPGQGTIVTILLPMAK